MHSDLLKRVFCYFVRLGRRGEVNCFETRQALRVMRQNFGLYFANNPVRTQNFPNKEILRLLLCCRCHAYIIFRITRLFLLSAEARSSARIALATWPPLPMTRPVS